MTFTFSQRLLLWFSNRIGGTIRGVFFFVRAVGFVKNCHGEMIKICNFNERYVVVAGSRKFAILQSALKRIVFE